jgi:hypothetical protein
MDCLKVGAGGSFIDLLRTVVSWVEIFSVILKACCEAILDIVLLSPFRYFVRKMLPECM